MVLGHFALVCSGSRQTSEPPDRKSGDFRYTKNALAVLGWSWQGGSGLLARRHDFEQFHGGLLIAVYESEPPVGGTGDIEPKPLHHRRAGLHPQIGSRLDAA